MSLNYTQTRWSLADLFPSHDSPEMKEAFAELESMVADFERRREQLAADISPGDFLKIVGEFEQLTQLGYRIYGFASLYFSEDTQSQAAQTFLAQVEQFMASVQNRTLFFSLWWKELADEPAGRLMAAVGDYRYWLEEMRHFKPHTLSEAEEKIVNIKNVTGSSALSNLYDAMTNRYVCKLEVNGEVKELTRGEVMVYARHHDPDLRHRAYQELYRVYGDDGPILGQMYQTLVRDWRNEQVDLRRFGAPIAARNLMNDIPDQVVDTLLEVCKRNAPLFQRFFRLKARWLGMERLRRYDIYAPVVKAEKKFLYNQAAQMLLDSFRDFDPRIADLAERVFSENHLDSEVRKGKRGGAFCSSLTPSLTPWVLLNYQGQANDVATMAHELGHAIHSILSSYHSLFTFHASLPLAETASTFGEMMLIDRLLADESDEHVRRDLLFRQIDDAYATIMRQAFFALFERQAHELTRQGAAVDDLAGVYLENLRDQFGEAVEISEEFKWEWVSIPHIYQVPFYVYAYAFGKLLVLALYRQFNEEGEAFKPRYIKILAAGGSEAPGRGLAEAGFEVSRAAFWQGGFVLLGEPVGKVGAGPISVA